VIRIKNDFLRGSYTPLITPFLDNKVDYKSFSAFIDWQINNGTNGLLICGTSGEPFSLSLEERMDLLRVALDSSYGRVPVIAQVSSMSYKDTIRLAVHAEQANADAVMVMPPPFFKAPQRGIGSFISAIAQETSIPILIYQIPSRTSVGIEIDTLETVSKKFKNIVGLKQSANNIEFDALVIKKMGEEFRIFLGLPEILYSRIPQNATGFIVAISNIFPGRVARIYKYSFLGQYDKAEKVKKEVESLNSVAFLDTNPIGIKYMAWKLGLIRSGEHRLPLVAPKRSDQAIIDLKLREIINN